VQTLVSLEWATDYFATSRPKSDEWDAADDAERQRYLNWASVLIRSAFVWRVDITDNDQVRIAVCEQALWLMWRPDKYPELLTKGLSSASVGNGAVSASFSKEFIAPLICDEAKTVVNGIGDFIGKIARITTRPLCHGTCES